MKNKRRPQKAKQSVKVNQWIKSDTDFWNSKADAYDKDIVKGHPDIVAFENFEMLLVDDILKEIAKKNDAPIKLIDLCTGTGRIFEHYLSMPENKYPEALTSIHGIDISQRALEISGKKINELKSNRDIKTSLEQRSVLDLEIEPDSSIPVFVNLNNAIGNLQGPDGAEQLFKRINELVKKTNGIAIISCFLREYIEQYALNQYESTMQVYGQPNWLESNSYTSRENTITSKETKVKGDSSTKITCDILGKDNEILEEDLTLQRSPSKTRAVVLTGNIKTHLGYSTMWYSDSIIEQWIKKYWSEFTTYHIFTRDLDQERAEFGQLAIIDGNNYLEKFF